MNKKRVKLSGQIKSEIILALQDPFCVVASLAKHYGVSERTIHQLRRYHGCHISAPSDEKAPNGFVELVVQGTHQAETEAHMPPSQPLPLLSLLDQASFAFRDVSLTLNGTVNIADLLGFVRMLGGRC